VVGFVIYMDGTKIADKAVMETCCKSLIIDPHVVYHEEDLTTILRLSIVIYDRSELM